MKKLFTILLAALLGLSAQASNVVFSFTNSSTGQLDTNDFKIIPLGHIRNSDGTFNNPGLPLRIHNQTGVSTNWLVAQYYQITNQFIGDGFFIRCSDSSSNIVMAGDKSIYCGSANPFIEIVVTNTVIIISSVATNGAPVAPSQISAGNLPANVTNTAPVSLAQLPDAVLTNNETGVTLGGTFNGSGTISNALTAAVATNALMLNGVPSGGFIQWQTNATQLQASWLALPVYTNNQSMGGGTIYLSNGVYVFNQPLMFSRTNTTFYTFIGAGNDNTVLLFTCSNVDCMTFQGDTNRGYGNISVDFENLTLAATVDSTNFILVCNGQDKVIMHNFSMGWWPEMTNQGGLGLTLDYNGNDHSATNLCGLYLKSQNGDFADISSGNFNYLHQCMVFNSDHVRAQNLWFGGDANVNGTKWPTNSPFYPGCCENLMGGALSDYQFTGFHEYIKYTIGGNEIFLNCPVGNDPIGSGIVFKDDFNEGGGGVLINTNVFTGGMMVVFSGGYGHDPFLDGNYFTYNNGDIEDMPVPNPYWISYEGLSDADGVTWELYKSSILSSGAITAPRFIGSGSGLTNLQASGVSTNGSTAGQVMINGGNGTVVWTNNQSVVAAGAGETAETMTTNPVTGQVTYTSNVDTNQFLASTGNSPFNGSAITNLNLQITASVSVPLTNGLGLTNFTIADGLTNPPGYLRAVLVCITNDSCGLKTNSETPIDEFCIFVSGSSRGPVFSVSADSTGTNIVFNYCGTSGATFVYSGTANVAIQSFSNFKFKAYYHQ